MNFIQVSEGHFINKDAYTINRSIYKGIGRPLRTDYKLKKLEKVRKARAVKSVQRTGLVDRLSISAVITYLFIGAFYIAQKGF